MYVTILLKKWNVVCDVSGSTIAFYNTSHVNNQQICGVNVLPIHIFVLGNLMPVLFHKFIT